MECVCMCVFGVSFFYSVRYDYTGLHFYGCDYVSVLMLRINCAYFFTFLKI